MKRHRSDRLDVVCAPRESRARRALRFAWCLALLGCLQLTWDAPLAFCALRAGRYVQQPLALKGESAAFGRRAVIPAATVGPNHQERVLSGGHDQRLGEDRCWRRRCSAESSWNSWRDLPAVRAAESDAGLGRGRPEALSVGTPLLAADDPDLMELTQDIDAQLGEADYLAYSSNFCGTAAGGTANCDKKFLQDSLKATIVLRSQLQNLLKALPGVA
mmetsp:Transcript_40354/g.81403  ORF Transcript_40354/g.81403 Transcript_40354/m.81403 type:complete len:217 (-) Transcript_40354:61-711(-)